MGYNTAATRLGEVLTDKGLITPGQLQDSIRVQEQRRQKRAEGPVALGEIMIEFGYINRYQLHRSLTWQSYLRKLTMLVAVCTPLLTVGCGGAASDEEAVATQPATNLPKPTPEPIAEPVPTPEPNPQPTPEPIAESPVLKGAVDLNWTAPELRVSGEALDITELGGYELRYKLKEEEVFTYVHIDDPWQTSHRFDWLEGDYLFQIAAYDNTGNYSDFVDLARSHDRLR